MLTSTAELPASVVPSLTPESSWQRLLTIALLFLPRSIRHIAWLSKAKMVQRLIIGSNVSDGSLLRASERFGIPLQDLMAFRATNVDITKLPVWRPAVEVINPDGAHKFEVLSEPMPMLEAREIAEKAMASRDDIVSASVRRCADVAHGVARQAALS